MRFETESLRTARCKSSVSTRACRRWTRNPVTWARRIHWFSRTAEILRSYTRFGASVELLQVCGLWTGLLAPWTVLSAHARQYLTLDMCVQAKQAEGETNIYYSNTKIVCARVPLLPYRMCVQVKESHEANKIISWLPQTKPWKLWCRQCSFACIQVRPTCMRSENYEVCWNFQAKRMFLGVLYCEINKKSKRINWMRIFWVFSENNDHLLFLSQ